MYSSNKLQSCIDDLLIGGLDDWIPAAEVASVAITVGGKKDPDEVRELSFAIIRKLLMEKLVEAGDYIEDESRSAGFYPWGLSPEASVVRIEKEWIALGRLPNLYEIFWLSLTEEGKKRARLLKPD
ncbi:MAG: hypothetical protein C4534_06870 [Gaiellales bacterium]|nr:MAG: hypothetical protein C4534_06870 [Gaiellales bacterium]